MKIVVSYRVVVVLCVYVVSNECAPNGGARKSEVTLRRAHALVKHPDRLVPVPQVSRTSIEVGSSSSNIIHVGERIIGGSDVVVSNSFPWQASLQLFSKGTYWHICGGSLLSANILLTAGHCVTGMRARDLRVIVGFSDLLNMGNAQMTKVKSYVKHPSYNSSTTVTMSDDIAIVLLRTRIVQNANVKFAHLPTNPGQSFAGTTCTITGWGRNSVHNSLAMMLQQADSTVIDNAECASLLAGIPIWNKQICVEDSSRSVGPCNGDSGGPLNCPDGSGGYYVCGITSWGVSYKDTKTGSSICVVSYPSVFTRVTTYLDWINSVLATNR